MSLLCLTGWQQPADALKTVAPDAVHFDYGAHSDLASCYAALAEHAQVKTVIGWSLGARIAMVAVAHKILRPERVFLLSSKYQCMADEEFPHGMSRTLMEDTKQFYFTDPEKMIAQFQLLVVKGDLYEKQLTRRMLASMPKLWPNGFFWLEQLERIRARDLDCGDFPETHIIHGDKDVITPMEHAEYLQRAIPGSKLHIWEGCAHAPHLHDAGRLEKMVG